MSIETARALPQASYLDEPSREGWELSTEPRRQRDISSEHPVQLSKRGALSPTKAVALVWNPLEDESAGSNGNAAPPASSEPEPAPVGCGCAVVA